MCLTFIKKNKMNKKNKKSAKAVSNPIERVRRPRKEEREILATVDSKLGGRHLKLKCMDGTVRMGRIPGSMKKRKRNWINEGDIVIGVPWEIQDSKADVVWRYTRSQVNWLEKKDI